MEKTEVEIERKFIIKKPDIQMLKAKDCYTVSEIKQIYLASGGAETHRVRSRSFLDKTVYTETKKQRIDKMSVIESEREIDEEEFSRLVRTQGFGAKTVEKTRHTFFYHGKTFEIDVYPKWKHTCILEVELPSREEKITFPPFLQIVREVTGNKAYTNATMSQNFPKEEGEV